MLHLSPDDTRTLADLLGATQVSEALTVVHQQIEGLAIEWLTLGSDSRYVGATIADGSFRTATGASIVAILRGGTTIPAPGADERLKAGDVLVAVGTADGLAQLRTAVFFLSFSFQIRPGDLVGTLLASVVLAAVVMATKAVTGWKAAEWAGVATRGRRRAAATLMARGEFSIVIASLGVSLADGEDLGALATDLVLITAIVGPVAARFVDRPAAAR